MEKRPLRDSSGLMKLQRHFSVPIAVAVRVSVAIDWSNTSSVCVSIVIRQNAGVRRDTSAVCVRRNISIRLDRSLSRRIAGASVCVTVRVRPGIGVVCSPAGACERRHCEDQRKNNISPHHPISPPHALSINRLTPIGIPVFFKVVRILISAGINPHHDAAFANSLVINLCMLFGNPSAHQSANQTTG